MIVRVARAVARSGAAAVVVATDDARVVAAVTAAGHEAALTRTDHPSGSDRVMEVVEALGWADDDVVMNVQGDEPLIPPRVLDQLADVLTVDTALDSATLCEPIEAMADLDDPNVVKVVRDVSGRALYFSRAPIPYDRDHFPAGGALPTGGHWWRHVGVYAYRVRALRRFVGLPTGALERLEKLEQLRLLENGMGMQVVEACEPVPGGVDTPEDLARVRRLLA
jgi:3-deoxy-manno-octulosonate cytidylyltransferase (CMP-KDO synthetase)